MAYNLAYLRNRVLDDKLDDTEYDGAVVDKFLKDAQREIYNTYELPFTQGSYTGLVTEGGLSFQLPADCQVPTGLTVANEDKTQPYDITRNYLDFRSFNSRYPEPANNTSGKPYVWTMYGGVLKFSTPIDGQYYLTIDYTAKAPTLEDDADVPGVPEEFEELLVLGAYVRVLKRNEDFDLAAAAEQEYTKQLNLMLYRYGKPQTGSPTIIKQPRRR